MSRSISHGSWPRTHSPSPRLILCDMGASMIALATEGDESASPTPVMFASVWTLTTSVSWLPSQRSLTLGRRRWMASTLVIFMGWRLQLQQCFSQFDAVTHIHVKNNDRCPAAL